MIERVRGRECEQIYLATRLVLADVLARDERQLVALDDVLTATDTGRLARVGASGICRAFRFVRKRLRDLPYRTQSGKSVWPKASVWDQRT